MPHRAIIAAERGLADSVAHSLSSASPPRVIPKLEEINGFLVAAEHKLDPAGPRMGLAARLVLRGLVPALAVVAILGPALAAAGYHPPRRHRNVAVSAPSRLFA